LKGWAPCAEFDARHAAGLDAAADKAAAPPCDAIVPWQQLAKVSVRGRNMTFWPVMGAATLGRRRRGFFWLTILDSKRP
jgi:hypothetical protein